MSADKWIPIEEKQPETKDRVLVSFENEYRKQVISIAEYIAMRTVLAEDYMADDSAQEFDDYDEEKDCYWTREGFYEWQYVADINYYLHEKVTHWLPLPELPDKDR